MAIVLSTDAVARLISISSDVLFHNVRVLANCSILHEHNFYRRRRVKVHPLDWRAVASLHRENIIMTVICCTIHSGLDYKLAALLGSSTRRLALQIKTFFAHR